MSSLSAPITGATAARGIAADGIATGDQNRHAQRQADHVADQKADAECHRHNRSNADQEERAKRQNRCDAHRCAQHDDRAFEQEFRTERNTRNKARRRHPRRAHGEADQDRQHQRFKISLTDEVHLRRLQQARKAGDGDAEYDARQQSMQLLDQIAAPCKTEPDAERITKF
jgi:hypothetical protein